MLQNVPVLLLWDEPIELKLWHFATWCPVADLGDLPAEERRDGDEPREDPDGEDHEHDPEGGPLGEVVDGLGDGPVAVERDQADVHDGGRAGQHVHRRVNVAPHLAEHPVACVDFPAKSVKIASQLTYSKNYIFIPKQMCCVQ